MVLSASVHHDLEITDEDETCIPSPAVLPGQRDITCSLATEVAQCHFYIAQAPASGMGYKHSTQHDIKSHPPDEVGLNHLLHQFVLSHLRAPCLQTGWPEFSL